MSWNHRVIKVVDKTMGVDEEWYAIHEVYYTKMECLQGMLKDHQQLVVNQSKK